MEKQVKTDELIEQFIKNVNDLIGNHLKELFKAQLEFSKHLADSDRCHCKMYYFDVNNGDCK